MQAAKVDDPFSLNFFNNEEEVLKAKKRRIKEKKNKKFDEDEIHRFSLE